MPKRVIQATRSPTDPYISHAHLQLTEKKTTRQFKTLDSVLQTIDPVTGEKQAVTYRCVDIDKMVPSLMGVSKVCVCECVCVCVHERMPSCFCVAGHLSGCPKISPIQLLSWRECCS